MTQPSAQRRLAAILVADVVGYSRLMEADETGTHLVLKQRRGSIVEPMLKEHSGRIVKFMGDGVLVEFVSVVDAVTCALALQERMAEANESLPDGQRIVLRIGEALAEPGGVCVASNVHDAVRGKLDFARSPGLELAIAT